MTVFVRRWHRRLGLALGWLMLIWFLSGGVMMYAHIPSKYRSPGGQASLNTPLSESQIKLGFSEAWQRSGRPGRLRGASLENFNGRPLYRFLSAGQGCKMVWADTGKKLSQIRPGLAMDAARSLLKNYAPMTYSGLIEYDQWTVGAGSKPSMRPLYKLSFDDRAGAEVYVSSRTGAICQQTTARSRFWSWMGAVPHWLYFTVLRQHLELWHWTIIILAALGCVLCLSGLWLGVKFFRFSGWGKGRRHRLSAFINLRKRHHYLGLAFGLPALAWAFSGMMSMEPFDWHTPTTPARSMSTAWRGGPLNPGGSVLSPARAIAALPPGFSVKLLRLAGFQGRPYYLALNGARESRLIPAWQEQAAALKALPLAELTSAAKGLLPGFGIDQAALLPRGGLYLPRWTKPVVRITYTDPAETWLYIDPKRARIVKRLDSSGRLNRWLYKFLHCLDLPWLLSRPVLRESILLFLLAGGSALCFTGPYAWLKRRRRKPSNGKWDY